MSLAIKDKGWFSAGLAADTMVGGSVKGRNYTMRLLLLSGSRRFARCWQEGWVGFDLRAKSMYNLGFSSFGNLFRQRG
jgi:hypothetical protein